MSRCSRPAGQTQRAADDAAHCLAVRCCRRHRVQRRQPPLAAPALYVRSSGPREVRREESSGAGGIPAECQVFVRALRALLAHMSRPSEIAGLRGGTGPNHGTAPAGSRCAHCPDQGRSQEAGSNSSSSAPRLHQGFYEAHGARNRLNRTKKRASIAALKDLVWLLASAKGLF